MLNIINIDPHVIVTHIKHPKTKGEKTLLSIVPGHK